MTQPVLSVLIVSFNTRQLTLDCIESVLKQAAEVPLEIVVVDNASRDGSADAIAQLFPSVRLVRLSENVGFGKGNNYAAEHAGGEYLLLLNPDTVVHEGALRASLDFARKVPTAAVVGCRTLNSDGSLQRNCFLPPSLLNILITTVGLHRAFPRSRFCGRERMTYWDSDDARPVPVVAGCFMLARRKAVDEVGLFDERFFMYAEEVDWCVRLGKAGWEVWYTPDATITHFGGVSAATIPGEMRLEAQRSLVLFLQKHHGRLYVAACRATLLVGLVTRTLAHTVIAALRGRFDTARERLKEAVKMGRLQLGSVK